MKEAAATLIEEGSTGGHLALVGKAESPQSMAGQETGGGLVGEVKGSLVSWQDRAQRVRKGHLGVWGLGTETLTEAEGLQGPQYWGKLRLWKGYGDHLPRAVLGAQHSPAHCIFTGILQRQIRTSRLIDEETEALEAKSRAQGHNPEINSHLPDSREAPLLCDPSSHRTQAQCFTRDGPQAGNKKPSDSGCWLLWLAV